MVKLDDVPEKNYGVEVSSDLGVSLGEVLSKKLQKKMRGISLELDTEMCRNYKNRKLVDGAKLKLLAGPQEQRISLVDCSNVLDGMVFEMRVFWRSTRMRKSLKVVEEFESLCQNLDLVDVLVTVADRAWVGDGGWSKATTQGP